MVDFARRVLLKVEPFTEIRLYRVYMGIYLYLLLMCHAIMPLLLAAAPHHHHHHHRTVRYDERTGRLFTKTK